MPRSGGHPVDGRGRNERGQRASRIVQRCPQTRSIAGQQLLGGRRHLPPGSVPVAGPLQHQTATLPLPLRQSHQLRKDPHTRYAARSRITTNPVSTTRGQGPAVHLARRLTTFIRAQPSYVVRRLKRYTASRSRRAGSVKHAVDPHRRRLDENRKQLLGKGSSL